VEEDETMSHGATPESRPGDGAGEERPEDVATSDGPTPERQPRRGTDEPAVDPMAPGRSIVDPDVGDAVEPNEPA
jgi:hypothetical protein